MKNLISRIDILLIFSGFIFLAIFFILFIIQYFYISKNLKGLCEIIFNDSKAYKVPLEPFDFYFLSCLPLVFWRETLSIKKGIIFSKLYGKEYYFKIEKNQLIQLFEKYPRFFQIQYLIFIFIFFAFIFMFVGVFLNKFFFVY